MTPLFINDYQEVFFLLIFNKPISSYTKQDIAMQIISIFVARKRLVIEIGMGVEPGGGGHTRPHTVRDVAQNMPHFSGL